VGTSFKIYLPRAKDATVVPQASLPVEGYSGGCETVLLAEDEPAVRQSTREFLTLNGYIVLEAKNGTDALAIAREYKGTIHLMISDVVMPQMGGARLAAELAIERPEMKVLFVSGYAESTVQRHGAIDVTARFLQKPFSLRTLAHKIRRFSILKYPPWPRRPPSNPFAGWNAEDWFQSEAAAAPSRIIACRNPGMTLSAAIINLVLVRGETL
jgi:CheY-like chemotaxis protein